MTTPADETRPETAPPADTHPAPVAVGSTETLPLMAEVQSFLASRDELAKKLAEEIAATEQKLAELKRTAALLYPAPAAPVATKDRKLKKGRTKAAATASDAPAAPAEVTAETPAAA